MADTPVLPQPEPRKTPSKKRIGELLKRQRGICATCPAVLAKINNGMVFICAPFDVDHTQALDHLGSNNDENLRCLCRPCHAEKTKWDVKASAKGRRVRKDGDKHASRMKAKATLSREVYKRQRRENGSRLKSSRVIKSNPEIASRPLGNWPKRPFRSARLKKGQA